MKIFREQDYPELRSVGRPMHVAIGMFDGVHLGHQAVILSAVRAAELDGGRSAVLTFDPHPSRIFRPERPTPQIYPRAVKEELLREIGVDFCLEQRFDEAFAAQSASEFVNWLRRTIPRLASVSVGENFRFGKGRGGSPALLVEKLRGHGVSVFGCERVHLDGEPISSTRIRDLLPETPIERVNPLFGRPYRSIGIVREGKKLGRTIGFPTLNVPFDAEIAPIRGVYLARYRTVGPNPAVPRGAVANFGLRPTVEETAVPLLEVHSLGECPAGYGDTVLVEWIRLLREERKFAGIDELKAAIAADREDGLRWAESSRS
jgi:riboflavin kinase/FMN adenylyltransferase